MTALIGRLSGWLGGLAAWLFVLTGAMITWEVIARYWFNAPTIWAAELSQLVLIWSTFLAAAALLKDDNHIAINLLTSRLGAAGQRFCQGLSLVFITVFSGWITWHGFAIAGDSFIRGRLTGTLLNLPAWVFEAALPLGFGLLTLQALVKLFSLITRS